MPTQQYGTTSLRDLWCKYACKGSEYGDLGSACGSPAGDWADPSFFGKKIGGTPRVAVDAYSALEQALMSEGYKATSVWAYNCRPIASSGNLSLHGFGIAVDIDPNENPQTSGGDPYSGKLKKHHVDAVMKIKVKSGKHLWWWGGYWSGSTQTDRMHFQLDVPPSEVDNINWSTVPGHEEEGGELPELSTEAQRYWEDVYRSLKSDPAKPNDGDKNPPGAKLFSYWASVWRYSVKKTGLSGPSDIVGRYLKDTK